MLIRHNEDDLDKVFRQKLYHVQEEVPLHLWEGIRQKNTKKRRALIWWWALPTALLMIGTITYALVSGVAKEPVKAQLAENKKVDSEMAFQKKESKATALPVEENEKSFMLNTSPSEAKENYKLEKLKNSNRVQADKATRNFENESAPTTTVEFVADKSYFSKTSEDLTTEEIEFGAPHLDSNNKSSSSLPQVLKADIEQEVFSGGLPFVEPTSNKVPSRWSAGVYYTIAQPMRTKLPNAQDDAFDRFVDRTQLGLSHGTGVMLSYSLPWYVQVSAGLEYQRFNETHNWIDSSLVQKKTYVFDYDTTVTFTGTTVTQYVIDSTETNEWKTQSHSRMNRYSSVNIPVLLSWNYPFKKYSLGLEIGPVFRIQSVYNGEFVFSNWQSLPPVTGFWNETADANTVLISKSYELQTAQVYRNWRTDLHIGIHQSYAITPRLAASLSLQTRMMMNTPRTAGEMAHRIIQPGVRVGLNYFIK